MVAKESDRLAVANRNKQKHKQRKLRKETLVAISTPKQAQRFFPNHHNNTLKAGLLRGENEARKG
jgi:hypothetical protein